MADNDQLALSRGRAPEIGSSEMTARRDRPVAVFVRAHASDEKTINLVRSLLGGSHYDLYLCVNETNGPIHFPFDIQKLSLTTEHFRNKGFPCEAQFSMLYFSDVIFSIAKERIAGYKYYALIEYDVHFEQNAVHFMDGLSLRLSEENKPRIDLVGIDVSNQSDGWVWHASASKRYPKVISSFFPFVVLSERAIDQLARAREDELQAKLRLNRMDEPSAGALEDDWIYCEAFIASELHRAGFVVADLNWLVARAYRAISFNIGPAHLFEEGKKYDAEVGIVHPVCPAKDTLLKRLYIASTNGAVEEFINLLDSRSWPLPDSEIRAIRAKAEAQVTTAASTISQG